MIYVKLDIMYEDSIKKNIFERRARGETFRSISANMNISISSIYSILNRKVCQHKKKRGPKRKLGKKDVLQIKRAINAGVTQGQRITSVSIVKDLTLSVSPVTVQRHLKREDVAYKKAKQQIILSPKHKRLRKEIVIGWIRENIQWSRVIFSDEKRFCQDGPDNWCSFVPKNISIVRNKRQNGGRGIMVWGMVFPNGKVFLKEMFGKQNSAKYKDLLASFAVPAIELEYKQDYIFQQDNCAIHVSRQMMTYFAESTISLLKWPARSPDLNLMENVWKMMSDHVYSGEQATSIEVLREKVLQAVDVLNETKSAEIRNLFATMTCRLAKVLDLDGNI